MLGRFTGPRKDYGPVSRRKQNQNQNLGVKVYRNIRVQFSISCCEVRLASLFQGGVRGKCGPYYSILDQSPHKGSELQCNRLIPATGILWIKATKREKALFRKRGRREGCVITEAQHPCSECLGWMSVYCLMFCFSPACSQNHYHTAP